MTDAMTLSIMYRTCAALIRHGPAAPGSTYDHADADRYFHSPYQNPHVSNRRWRQDRNSIDEPVSQNEQHETPNDPEQEKEGVAEPQKRGNFRSFSRASA